MAFGIDDALAAAGGAIKITDTLVRTIERYRKDKKDLDIELLIEETRITALRGIDDGDLALTQFERMLIERKVDLGKTLMQVIDETSIWAPWEQFRLKQFRRQFNAFSDTVYSASDDIAALVRCRQQAEPMGKAVAESAREKHQLSDQLNNAPSLKAAIGLLRVQLKKHKEVLMRL